MDDLDLDLDWDLDCLVFVADCEGRVGLISGFMSDSISARGSGPLTGVGSRLISGGDGAVGVMLRPWGGGMVGSDLIEIGSAFVWTTTTGDDIAACTEWKSSGKVKSSSGGPSRSKKELSMAM